MAAVVNVISEHRSLVGEGPFWDAKHQKLLHVDIEAHSICHLDPKNKLTELVKFDGTVSFVIPYKDHPGRLLLSVKDDIKTLTSWTSNEVTNVAGSERGSVPTRFNDAKCDSAGRLWAGTMSLENRPGVLEPYRGALYSLGRGVGLRKHAERISISNGMAWTSDDRIMFFIDSYAKKIYAFDYDLQFGKLSNSRVFVDFNTTPGFSDCGLPDGMTIDTNNHLWVACYDAGRVIKIDSTSARLLQTVTFSATKITSCCFGGPNYDELFVTSAYSHLSPEEVKKQPDAGAVFRVSHVGARGTEGKMFSE